MTTSQLILIESAPARFRLDERTRVMGLAGIASARSALRQAADRRESVLPAAQSAKAA